MKSFEFTEYPITHRTAGPERPGMPPTNPHLAHLYYSWAELDVLADLVDEQIADGRYNAAGFALLNSLRTSLREAQYSIRAPR